MAPRTRTRGAAALLALMMAVAACGSDDGGEDRRIDDGSVTGPAGASASGSASGPAGEPAIEEPGAAGDGAAEEEVKQAYLTVFDSEVPFDEKFPYLEDAEQLRSTFESYADTAEGFGGISLEPTVVVIDGDTAEVTYNVLFGGSAAYSDMTGDAVLRDGVWKVTRARFCAFMSSARVSCPSG